jgi:K+-transporting ATPase KdpF subunit
MTVAALYAVCALVALGLLVYLVFALLRAEVF